MKNTQKSLSWNGVLGLLSSFFLSYIIFKYFNIMLEFIVLQEILLSDHIFVQFLLYFPIRFN